MIVQSWQKSTSLWINQLNFASLKVMGWWRARDACSPQKIWEQTLHDNEVNLCPLALKEGLHHVHMTCIYIANRCLFLIFDCSTCFLVFDCSCSTKRKTSFYFFFDSVKKSTVLVVFVPLLCEGVWLATIMALAAACVITLTRAVFACALCVITAGNNWIGIKMVANYSSSSACLPPALLTWWGKGGTNCRIAVTEEPWR